MKRALSRSSLFLAALLCLAGCGSSGGDLSDAGTQRRFGVRMARMNLWREAMFRFQRATQIEPDDAMAHNNLAVAFEATGDFDAAAKEYREALRLDRSNEYIQKNYSRFVEFTQRGKKRDAGPATPAAGDDPAATQSASPLASPLPAAGDPRDPAAPVPPPPSDRPPTPPQEGAR